MAKDVYDKLKAIGDLIKQYWAIGLMILAALGNVYQYRSANKTVEVFEYQEYFTLENILLITNVTDNTNYTNNTISNSLTDNKEVGISEVSEVGSVKSIQGGLE